MSIFDEVKQYVTARQIAEYQGIQLNRSGMCCCPFHSDRTPSMKIDKNYHCFGCNVGGDAIDLMARLKGISQIEAAKEIVKDFSLPVEVEVYSKKRKRYRKRPQKTEEQKLNDIRTKLDQWLDKAIDTFISYLRLIEFWKEQYKPKEGEDELHDLFIEALDNEAKVNADLDILMYGSGEDMIDFFKSRREEVKHIEKRVEEYKRCVSERSGADCSGRTNDSPGDSGTIRENREG